MAPDSVGGEVEKIASNLKPGEIMLLENLRFHVGEKHPEKDPSFAENLAKLADIYVNDAFGTAHRKHSSTYTITKFFSGSAVLGFLFEKEIKNLKNLLTSKETPFLAWARMANCSMPSEGKRINGTTNFTKSIQIIKITITPETTLYL